MLQATYVYPGDPPTIATFLFGREFLRVVRGDQPAFNQILTEAADGINVTRIEADYIVCDVCGNAIGLLSPCVSVRDTDRLHCWNCAVTWILPHVQRQTIQLI